MQSRLVPFVLLLLVATLSTGDAPAQDATKKTQPPFQWVNPPNLKLPGLKHGVFKSPSMGLDVGYCIYLPPGYEDNADRRYPVVYYLHGGRPGNESKSIRLAVFIHQYITTSGVPPLIKGFNYENNLEYMKFLESLEIPFQRLIVEGVPHSAQQIYEKRGLELINFHVESFRRSGALPSQR